MDLLDDTIRERRVLIVDDEPLVLSSLQKVLERAIAPSAVLVARSGEEAIEKLDESDVELVVTDLSMPGGDGFHLLERLKNRHFRGQTAVISGSITPEIELRLRNLGVLVCFQKPIQPSRFLNLCRRALEGHDNNLRGLSPIGVAQMLELEGKSCLLRMHHGDRRGDLVFSAGKLVDAWTEDENGEAAAETILGWPAAEMRLHYVPSREKPRIRRTLEQIMLEVALEQDEALRDQRGPCLSVLSEEEPSPRFCPEQLDQAFRDLLAIEGARHLVLVDTALVDTAPVDRQTSPAIREASKEGVGAMSEAKLHLLGAFTDELPPEDVLITWPDQEHLMRPLLNCERYVFYMILERHRVNLGHARHLLEKHCSRVRPVML